MSRGINKVIIIGNLGQDPEVRYMPSGGAVTTCTLATSEQWKDKSTGQMQERTEWHRVVFYNRLAEIAGEYLKKGSKCFVEGSLRTNKWQDKNGQDRYTTEIIAREMQMLDGRQSGGQGQYGGGQAPAAPRANNPPNNNQGYNQPNNNQGSNQQNNNQGGQQPSQNQPTFDDFDDDIPF